MSFIAGQNENIVPKSHNGPKLFLEIWIARAVRELTWTDAYGLRQNVYADIHPASETLRIDRIHCVGRTGHKVPIRER